MKTRIFLILGASLALAACATAPKPLQGQFSTVSPRDSVAQQQTGTPVRWGGRIIETLPGQGETCFQMLARPLARVFGCSNAVLTSPALWITAESPIPQ